MEKMTMSRDWKTVALRSGIYEALEIEADKQHRTVTNCLEVILCKKLGVNLESRK